MAEEKFTIVDLRKAIVKQTEIEEAQVSAFLNQLIATVKDGLRKDKIVRISGLGTFKLQWVEPRKSVNISTGEPIVIDGYQKLSFTPEQSVKERINEPYADLAPVILDEEGNAIEEQMPKSDPMQKFDEQALEIKDILADLGADLTKQEPAIETNVEEVEKQAEETVVESKETAVDEKAETQEVEIKETAADEKAEKQTFESKETAADEKAEKQTVESKETAADEKAETQAVESNETAAEEKTETQAVESNETAADTPKVTEIGGETKGKEEKNEKPFRGWLVAIITVLSLIILLFICGLFLQNKIEEWADMLNGKIGAEETMVDYDTTPVENAVFTTQNAEVPAGGSADSEAIASTSAAENGDSSALAEAAKPLPKTDFYKERVYTEFIGFETVREGSRLTWIAKKFYDNKDFWVFIYEANRDKIKNPSTVTVGTQLKIPVLPDELSDPNNMKAQHLIKKLQEQYLNQ